jgi:hypothetical protein
MFENKAGDPSTSPPSRGRSPSNSVASTSSRPVSKVRASFVAVERSGEQGQLWGLRKASDVSSMAEVIKENESSVMDGIPLGKSQTTPERKPNGGLGAILKGSAFVSTPSKEEPNKMDLAMDKQKSPLKPISADKQNKQPTSNGVGARASEAAKKIQEKTQPDASKPKAPAQQSVKHQPKPIETKASAPKPDKQSPKTPTSAGVKTRGGVAKIQGVMESAKRASEARELAKKSESAKKEPAVKSPTNVTATKDTPKSPAKHMRHSTTATSATATSAAHVQKEPEPPKRATHSSHPGRLPAAVTATTAASKAHDRTEPEPPKKVVHSNHPAKLPAVVTATTAASKAHDRSAPDSQFKKPAPRRQSEVHSSKPRLSTTSQASLAKKTSRASLAERPKSRASINKHDESFLARMMRPTESSAQKTHEKIQVSSPPRAKPAAPKVKSTSRPSLNGHAHHDHVDPAGDYTRPPISPTAAKHAQSSHKPKPATAQQTISDKKSSERTEKPGESPAESKAPEKNAAPEETIVDGPEPEHISKEDQEPDIEVAVAESTAKQKDSMPSPGTDSSTPEDEQKSQAPEPLAPIAA